MLGFIDTCMNFIPVSCHPDRVVEWPFEESPKEPGLKCYLAKMNTIFQEAGNMLHQSPLHSAVSPTGRIHGSKNQGVEVKMSCLPFI